MYNYKPMSPHREYIGEADYLEPSKSGSGDDRSGKPKEEKKPTALEKLLSVKIFK